jgi:SAM-dependent methyltransferase
MSELQPQKTDYHNLFEGKFTGTHHFFRRNPIAWFYYHVSAATAVARQVMKATRQAVTRSPSEIPVILDVGCGGGVEDLVQLGVVMGMDISKSSLQRAARIYHSVTQINLLHGLPLADRSVDVIFCQEVMGHIHQDDKHKVYAEMRRVLRPGGSAVFSIETDGDNWLTRWLHRKGYYQELWVDYQGHIGMQTPQETVDTLARFLEPVEVRPGCTWMFPIDEFLILKEQMIWPKWFESTALRRMANLLLGPLFWLSLHVARFESVNDLVIVAHRR